MSEQEIRDLCQDRHKYPFEIPDTFGEGITGSKYYTQRTKRPREVRLKITSFIGVCGGAMHYYGELASYSPTVSEIGGDPSIGFFGALHGEDHKELFKDLDIHIELLRPIEDWEREQDPNRFAEYYDTTNCWYDKESIKAFADEVFKARFVGDWVLKIVDMT